MNRRKERKRSRKAYQRLIVYLLQNIKSLENYERIFYFIQDIATDEIQNDGGGGKDGGTLK